MGQRTETRTDTYEIAIPTCDYCGADLPRPVEGESVEGGRPTGSDDYYGWAVTKATYRDFNRPDGADPRRFGVVRLIVCDTCIDGIEKAAPHR